MRGDHADYSGAPNRGCVRARAIFPCCDRHPDFTLSFDRLLWSACLPSSLARDRPNRFPRTLVSPDAQEQRGCGGGGGDARGPRGGRKEFLKAFVPEGRSVTGYGLGGRKPTAGDSSKQRWDFRLFVMVEPISSFWKCAILLVFVAQSTSHRCKSCMEFLFWVSMELYIPKTPKMTSFFFKCTI